MKETACGARGDSLGHKVRHFGAMCSIWLSRLVSEWLSGGKQGFCNGFKQRETPSNSS